MLRTILLPGNHRHNAARSGLLSVLLLSATPALASIVHCSHWTDEGSYYSCAFPDTQYTCSGGTIANPATSKKYTAVCVIFVSSNPSPVISVGPSSMPEGTPVGNIGWSKTGTYGSDSVAVPKGAREVNLPLKGAVEPEVPSTHNTGLYRKEVVVPKGSYLCGGFVTGPQVSNQWYPIATTVCESPHPSTHCSIPDITVDYGNVKSSEYDGKLAKAEGKITCDDDVEVNVSYAPDTVSLSNGTKAKLSFDESGSDNYTLTLKKYRAGRFTVDSVLSGTNPPKGTFTGSTVVLFTIL